MSSNLPFEDDPFNDDPFRDIPNASDSSSGLPPRGNTGIGNARLSNDLTTISGSPLEDTTQDLPADLLLPPVTRSRNTIFVVGLALLAIVVVVGLVVILYAALQNGDKNRIYQQTVVAALATNNAVYTQVAATATAHSWTLTPSKTATATLTLTPSVTITPSPTITLTPSQTPTVAPTDTRAPGVTPPTVTPLPPTIPPTTVVPPTIVVNNDSLNTQVARLQSAAQILRLQQTLIAVQPKNAVRQTESAQIGSALTAIAVQLGPNAANSGATGGVSAPTIVPTNSPTASPTISPTLPELFPATITLTPSAIALNVNAGQPVLAIRQVQAASSTLAPTKNAVQSLGTSISPQPSPATLSGTLIAVTATAQALLDNEAQLNQVQTAIGIQLTMNGMTATSVAGNAANDQLQLGLTAVAYQLSQDQIAFNRLTALTATTPRTGLYEDLANGRATPASLALLGLAGLGLIAVIVVSRRMRVRSVIK